MLCYILSCIIFRFILFYSYTTLLYSTLFYSIVMCYFMFWFILFYSYSTLLYSISFYSICILFCHGFRSDSGLNSLNPGCCLSEGPYCSLLFGHGDTPSVKPLSKTWRMERGRPKSLLYSKHLTKQTASTLPCLACPIVT